jgi:hypothetical protein
MPHDDARRHPAGCRKAPISQTGGTMLAASSSTLMFPSTPEGPIMNKLTLDVESLEVQSFAVAAADPVRGTVMAHSGFTHCGNLTCLLSLCDCAAV